MPARSPSGSAPLWLFTAGYVGFLLVLFIPLARWMPNTLRRLSIRPELFGYVPPMQTIGVYLGTLLALWGGYLTVTRYWLKYDEAAPARITRTQKYLIAAILGTSAIVFVIQCLLLNGIPLLQLDLRWQLNVKLVALFSSGLIALASLAALVGWRWYVYVAAAAMLGMSGLLGTRTLPLVGVVALVVVMGLVGNRRSFRVTLAAAALAGILVMLVVGAGSKSQIYQQNAGYDPALGVGLMQSDSIGSFYNMEQIQEKVDHEGQMKYGKLSWDTLMNMVPGVQRDYANYQLGTMLGGRTTVIVNGQKIERSVSLSATFTGAPYADGGWIGALAFGGVVGALWAAFEQVAKSHRWFVGLYAVWVARLCAGINAGAINESWYLTTLLAIVGLIVCVARRPGSARHLMDEADEDGVSGDGVGGH